MFLFIIILSVIAIILFWAFRIILRWIVPAPALAKFDRTARQTVDLAFHLSIVALALIILYALWAAPR